MSTKISAKLDRAAKKLKPLTPAQLRNATGGHEIVSPRDPQSGLPTGKRMHKPMVITKELDAAAPDTP
jgi:hypothetical protein